jgi:putative MATE family efflux protein
MHSTHPLLNAPILPTIWRLSLPNMLAMMASALVTIAETSYVGQLGIAPLAGMALVFPLIMLQQMLSTGAIGGGISSAVSRALGAGREDRAQSLALHASVIGLIMGLLFTMLFGVFRMELLQTIGGSGDALNQAALFAAVTFTGSVSIWLTNAFASVIRGSGNMNTPSAVLLTASLFQVLLGGSLGLGWGPVPRLGMVGVALGQVISFTGSAIFLGFYLHSPASRVRLVFKGPLRWADFYDILKVGGVSSLASIQTVLTILILTRLISQFGAEALAGYGIGTRLEFLLIPITFAIGVACVPMVGVAMGAGLVQRARKVAWSGGTLAAILIGVVGAFAALYPDAWSLMFSDSATVQAFTRSYFEWVGPWYGLFGFGLCLYFASQGSGKVLGPVLAGTVRLVMVAAGGLWMLRTGAGAADMFALVGVAMGVYGVATGLAMYWTSWGPDTMKS